MDRLRHPLLQMHNQNTQSPSPYGYGSPQYDASPQISPPNTSFHASLASSPGQFENQTSLSVAPHATSTPNKFTTRSCDVCRKRKVKCDKLATGCNNCAKANLQCHYPGPGRAPRRPKVGGKPITARETELLKRLRKLEGVVQELSGGQRTGDEQVDSGRSSVKSPPADRADVLATKQDGTSSDTSSSIARAEAIEMEDGCPATRKWLKRLVNIGDGPPQGDIITREFGKLVIDEKKSRYHNGKDIFENLAQGIEEIRELVEEDADQTSTVDSEAPDSEDLPDLYTLRPSSGHQSFIFGYSSSTVDLRTLHPLPSQIPFFWSNYVENIDPLTKIFHVPTMNVAIKKATNGWESVSPSMDAALFSIYYAVISSMSQSEVEASFDTDKTTLLSRYRFGVEQALARADLLTTTEIVTLQAYVLFLFCLKRHVQVKYIWSLTGIACRLAAGIGLHRDGLKLGMSPFDTEIRRRLWWALRFLDTRASEDFGADSALHEGMSDTLLPLNINDSDISPETAEMPKERVGVTDMTFCLMRYEISKVCRYVTCAGVSFYPYGRMVPDTTLQEKEQMVRNLNDTLETKYIKYCLDAGPLCWVGATVSRLVVAKLSIIPFIRGTTCNPADFPQHVRDRLFIASIEIMEYSSLLESGAHTKKWGWIFHTYVQWHALIFILLEICKRPSSLLLERAWRAVDSVFKNWDNAVKYSRSQKNGELWLPLKRLMAKARRKREDDIKSGVCFACEPEKPAETPREDTSDVPQVRLQYKPEGSLPYERHDMQEQQGDSQAKKSRGQHNIEVLRPLQQGIPRPDPRVMPEIYAAVPFSTSTWEQPAENSPYSSILQTQFQQFAQTQSYSQPHQHMQAQIMGQQQPQPGQMPWLMEAPLSDLTSGIEAGDGNGEMEGLENFSWEGIDDMVRDIQMQTGTDPNGGMDGAGWW